MDLQPAEYRQCMYKQYFACTLKTAELQWPPEIKGVLVFTYKLKTQFDIDSNNYCSTGNKVISINVH